MGEVLVGGVASEVLTALGTASSAYLAEVADGMFSGVSDADLLAELRAHELLTRRQLVAGQELLAELDRRGVANRLSMPSTAAILQAMLRVSPHEAKRRVQDAATFANRLTATGEALAPVRPLVARAQAAGEVSIEQARTIAKVLERIPSIVTVEDVTGAETSASTSSRHVTSIPARAVGRTDPGLAGSRWHPGN